MDILGQKLLGNLKDHTQSHKIYNERETWQIDLQSSALHMDHDDWQQTPDKYSDICQWLVARLRLLYSTSPMDCVAVDPKINEDILRLKPFRIPCGARKTRHCNPHYKQIYTDLHTCTIKYKYINIKPNQKNICCH